MYFPVHDCASLFHTRRFTNTSCFAHFRAFLKDDPHARGLVQLALRLSSVQSSSVQFSPVQSSSAQSSSVQSSSVQFSPVAQSCPTLCDPMNHSTPGLPVHHQRPESTQTHVHRVSDAIQPSHPLSSPSPPAPNPSQHQGLFQ